MKKFNIPEKDGFLCIGVISQAHSLKGEVIVKPLIDNPQILNKGFQLITVNDSKLIIEHIRESNKGLIIKFKEIQNRTEAENSRKTYLYLNIEELPQENDDEIYYYDLINYKLIDNNSNILGSVKGVFDTAANTVLEIEVEDSDTILIPYTFDIILDINKKDKELLVDKELFDIYKQL